MALPLAARRVFAGRRFREEDERNVRRATSIFFEKNSFFGRPKYESGSACSELDSTQDEGPLKESWGETLLAMKRLVV